MKTRLAVLAVLVALVAVTGCDRGRLSKPPANADTITIQRELFGNEDRETQVVSSGYSFNWEKRVITLKCPCYLSDDASVDPSVIAEFRSNGLEAADLKITLLSGATYNIENSDHSSGYYSFSLSPTQDEEKK